MREPVGTSTCNQSKQKKLFALFTPLVLVWIVDQVTKHWIRSSMELHRHEIVEGWLSLNYTQNPGMAMGMDWLSTPSISVVAILATILISVYVLRNLENANLAYLFCMGLILGGATGNITDRLVMGLIEGYGGVLHGHVIDFIHFTLTVNDSPVFPYIFNVADIAITTSIVIMLLFHKVIMPVDHPEPQESAEQHDEEVQQETEEIRSGSTRA